MARFPHKDLPLKKAELGNKKFQENKILKVGTKKSPAKVTVQNHERRLELVAIFEENKWAFEITVDAKKAENILDLEFLQNRKPNTITKESQNRNEPCACGSGKKFKKCHGAAD